MVDVDLPAVVQSHADSRPGLFERGNRALYQQVRHSGGLMRAQALDQQRLRLRRLGAHDQDRARPSRPACVRRRRHCRRRRLRRHGSPSRHPRSPSAPGPRWTRPSAANCRAFSTWSSQSSPRNWVPVAITSAGQDRERGLWLAGERRCRVEIHRLSRRRRCGRAANQISMPVCRCDARTERRSRARFAPGRPSSHSLG